MHLVCGEALFDIFVDDGACASPAEVPLRAVAGGSPFNVAIGMARLGTEVALASDLACDALGERLSELLRMEGVSSRFLRRNAPSTALAIVATDATGSPSYSFLGLQEATYAPELDGIEEWRPDITGLHLGSIALTLPHSARPLLDLARQLADRVLISLDPNIRLSIVPDIVAWHAAIEAHRRYAHVVKVSEEDISALYGDADPERICCAWLNDRTTLVVLTRGAKGASIFTNMVGRVDIHAVETNIADTIGAGDSFMAALLSSLRRGGLISSALIASLSAENLLALGRFAATAAALTCSRRGPVLPRLSEVESLASLPGMAAA